DRKLLALLERGQRGKPHVEPPEIELWNLPRDRVEALLHGPGHEAVAVAKQRALAVIAGEDQPERLAGREHAMALLAVPPQIDSGDAGGASVGADQLLERRSAIAHDRGKILERERHDPPPRLTGLADIEHARFALLLDQLLQYDALVK